MTKTEIRVITIPQLENQIFPWYVAFVKKWRSVCWTNLVIKTYTLMDFFFHEIYIKKTFLRIFFSENQILRMKSGFVTFFLLLTSKIVPVSERFYDWFWRKNLNARTHARTTILERHFWLTTNIFLTFF